MALVAAYFITLLAMNCTQCSPRPISVTWTSPGSCMPHQAQASSMGFINAIIDSTILMLPIRMVWALQMSHKQKVMICSVFGLGLLYAWFGPSAFYTQLTRLRSGVAVSLARAIAIANPDLYTGKFQILPHLTETTAYPKSGGALAFIVWSTTEPAVALICACLPVLRPLYTTGLAKLNSTRASWGRYHSRKSGSYVTTGNSTSKGNHPMRASIWKPKPTSTISSNPNMDYAKEEVARPPFVGPPVVKSPPSYSQRLNGEHHIPFNWASKPPSTSRARSNSDETAVTVWPTVNDQPAVPNKSVIQREVEARRYAGGRPKNWSVSGSQGW